MSRLLLTNVLKCSAKQFVLDDGALADAPIFVERAGRKLLAFKANEDISIFELMHGHVLSRSTFRSLRRLEKVHCPFEAKREAASHLARLLPGEDVLERILG